MNSIEKGKRGEREFAAWCRERGYEEARRGQQHSGGSDSPDVVGVPGLHCEIKRTETFRLWDGVEQAIRDAAGKLPWAVFHRPNKRKWIAVVDAEWLLKLHAFYESYRRSFGG